MEIKKKETPRNKTFTRISNKFLKIFLNKKVLKIPFGLFVFFIFIFGLFSGLVFSGYFGTFDEPSERAHAILQNLEVKNLYKMKAFAQGIIRENIRIPFNYLKSRFADVDKLIVDIKFDDLQKIEYERSLAIERGVLISTNNSYVPAKITVDGEEYDVKLRLKGDLQDHWAGDKWSFRVKVSGGDKILGMKVFSVQSPETREDMHEWLYHRLLKYAGVIGLRYSFVEVIINGENKGIYAIEEHFSKELIESNSRREGVILKFDESNSWENHLNGQSNEYEFFESYIDTFENENDILNDSIKLNQFYIGSGMLELLRNREMLASDIFDIETTAKYYAIGTLMNCYHGEGWINARFYYNPITSRLEMIGFDGNCRIAGSDNALMEYVPDCIYKNDINECDYPIGNLPDLILGDEKIFTRYVYYLNEFSSPGCIEDFLDENEDDIKSNINILRKDRPFFYFSEDILYNSRDQLNKSLHPSSAVTSYLNNFSKDGKRLSISAWNTYFLPIRVNGVSVNGVYFNVAGDAVLNSWSDKNHSSYYDIYFDSNIAFNSSNEINTLVLNYSILGVDFPLYEDVSILPLSKKEDLSSLDFIRSTDKSLINESYLSFDMDNKIVRMKSGSWNVYNNIVIPSGYSFFIPSDIQINLLNGSMILVNGPTYIGDSKGIVNIYSSDKSGQGLSILSNNSESTLINVIFSDMTNPSKGGWELSGAVNIHNSNVYINNVTFSGMSSEDSLNIIRSSINASSLHFKNCFSDCFDFDFDNGTIVNSDFDSCGNDCLDLSGSNYYIRNITINGIGDKGVSAGEKSFINASDIIISGESAYVGFASKDFSILSVINSSVDNSKYGMVAYQKKPEYGPSQIFSYNVSIGDDVQVPYLIEAESKLKLDEYIFLSSDKDVYSTLYDE